MSAFLPVDMFFEHAYLVDLSPSPCEVARKRFERLGWKNVTVLCQDARSFQLPEKQIDPRSLDGASTDRTDLITMSYSLSMIPGWYTPQFHLKSTLTLSTRLLQRCGLSDPAPQGHWNPGCL